MELKVFWFQNSEHVSGDCKQNDRDHENSRHGTDRYSAMLRAPLGIIRHTLSCDSTSSAAFETWSRASFTIPSSAAGKRQTPVSAADAT
jgi:hypothetical protein